MVQPPDAKTKGKSLGLGKDKAYLRMGSSEGSPACLGARSQRGIYTSVYVSLYDCVRVYLGLVPSPPNPSFSRLEGGHQPGGGARAGEGNVSRKLWLHPIPGILQGPALHTKISIGQAAWETQQKTLPNEG